MKSGFIHTILRFSLTGMFLLMGAGMVMAQTDKKEVRAGNRKFKKEKWQEAEIDYRRALVKDSLSFAANYNLANALYRQENMEESGKLLEKISEQASMEEISKAANFYFNQGNVLANGKQWQQAVETYKEALLRNPSDLEAKENYIYAKKMLKNQQNQQNQQNQDQNKDQNQDQQNQNQDQNKDQNQDQDQQNQNKDQQNQNKNQQDQANQNQQNQDGQQPKISPKQAQQMLKAIQAKEKETQDKVKKEKAEALKAKRKEKNW